MMFFHRLIEYVNLKIMEYKKIFIKDKNIQGGFQMFSFGFNDLNYFERPMTPHATLAPEFPVFNDYSSPFLPKSSSLA